MNTYIVLFRGINIGGNNRLPMKELKELVAKEGYENIYSYIQSGNVVLQATEDPKENIATKVNQTFGFKPEVLTLKYDAFKKAVLENPFTSSDGKLIHFYFCSKEPKLDKSKVDSLIANQESYHFSHKVFYLHAPNGIGRSKLVSNIERCLGASATGRNLNTVQKLLTMAEDIAS